MFNFENKVTIIHYFTNYIAFILFVPNYRSFGCVFPFFLALFRPPGSGSSSGPETLLARNKMEPFSKC
jgi:hypothetical protein